MAGANTSIVVAFHTNILGVNPNSEEAIKLLREHKQVIVCQKHWKGRGLRWMAGLMMKYTREVVLMQKYMRRHLIRTKMKRKRRRGMGKVTKFKICNRVMRGTREKVNKKMSKTKSIRQNVQKK